MASSSRFWDIMANRYAKSPVSDQATYQKKLQVTRDYMRPDMRLLEFGCGTGTTAITQAPHVKHILAIDFSARMLDIARAKAAAANVKNLTFEKSTIEDFPAPDASFDMVMGHSILHLLADREAAIARVYAMLTPGGYFVSSTSCMGGGFHIMKLTLPVGNAIGLLPLVRFFSVEQLVDSITSAGFEIDHQWQKTPKNAVFIVAKKPE